MTSQIPYNSYIVLINTNNSIINNTSEYTTWSSQLTLISLMAANLTEFLQMVSNIVVDTFSFYINNAETKQQLINIFNKISPLEKSERKTYIATLSNAFILSQFPVYISSLFTSCTYIDEKKNASIDYNQIALALAVNLAIVTSPANLKILYEYTKGKTSIQDQIDAVNGLDFIIIITADPTTADTRELHIDSIITNAVGPIAQYSQINQSTYAGDDDIDAVLYQETTLLNIMEKYTFLKIYMQNILKTRDIIVSIVLVSPTDTKFIKVLRIIVGIIIGICFIGVVPIVFSLVYYIYQGNDWKNVLFAIGFLVFLYIVISHFDDMGNILFA